MKKVIIGFSSILAIMVICFGIAYAYLDKKVWNQFLENAADTAVDEDQEKLNAMLEKENGYGKNRPLVYLIGGIDSQDVSSGRTDSLMLAVLDASDKKMSLLSIPRDLYVDIEGHGKTKINAAYSYGGINLTKKTVSNLFGVPIDQYVTIDFKGFEDLVDALGGIEIYVEKDLRFHDRISNKYFELSEGLQTLDGFQALNYARFRKDAEGDYGRMRRQQEVVSQIISETVSVKNITKIDDVADALGDNVKTDVPFKNISSLALKYIGFNTTDTGTIKLESTPQMINGVSYVVASDAQIEATKEELKKLLKGEK